MRSQLRIIYLHGELPCDWHLGFHIPWSHLRSIYSPVELPFDSHLGLAHSPFRVVQGTVPPLQQALELHSILSQSDTNLRQPVGLEEQLLAGRMGSDVGQSMLQMLQVGTQNKLGQLVFAMRTGKENAATVHASRLTNKHETHLAWGGMEQCGQQSPTLWPRQSSEGCSSLRRAHTHILRHLKLPS